MNDYQHPIKVSSSFKLYNVPDYKLSPPVVTPQKLLWRDNLHEKLKHLQAYKRKLLVIEAPAGSGKSVFAQQYTQDAGCSFGWCQLGQEDQDPIAFLNVLVTLLLQRLPGYESDNVAAALTEGAIHPSEASRFGTMLAKEICNVRGHQFLLVLDDLHLIEGSGESAALLISLIQHTPSWMQWILVSRHSVRSVLQVKRFDVPSLRVENSELDFSLEESAQLFQSLFGLALSFKQIQKLQQQTEGWITGLVLAALHREKIGEVCPQNECLLAPADIRLHLADFFLQDVLGGISQERIPEILQLVLLEEIPMALLCNLLGQEAGERLGRNLRENNRFFRCIDEERGIFSFHHLFRESLLPLAKKQLPIASQKMVFRKAVQYHLHCLEPLRALHYAIKCADISLSEEILSQFGFDLLHLNQIKTLHRILATFPEETVTNYPWLSYYFGTCLLDSLPSEALPYLIKAQTLFADQKNELGLLLANSQLVEFHVIIDGQFNLMEKYLPDLENIFSRKQSTLSLPLKLRIAHVLALGHCFLQSDMQKVEQYDTMALNLSRKNCLDNMTVSIRLIRAYRYGFVGDWEGCSEEVEASFPLMINPRVSTLNKLFLQLLQVNLLEMTGDFNNYRNQKLALEQVAEQDVVIQSVIGPFLYVWDIDSALAENDINTAERLVNKALGSSYAASKAHMRSQILHYHALILALRKKKKEALGAIQESLKLRQQVGGNAFVTLNHQIVGAAFAQLGMMEEAEEHFDRAMIISEKIGEEFQRVSIYAHRAWMRLQAGEKYDNVLEDIKQCLNCLKKNRYSHFFSFMPQVMEPVLKLAVCHNIEAEYAQKLLSEKLHKGIAKNGDLIPLLDIRLLSDLTISIPGGQQRNILELAESERQILYTLISSPGLQISQSVISLQLWPDKSPERQRSSLDVLISQTRKKLSQLVSPIKPLEYLMLKQGIVKLKNCRIDVLQFLQHAKQGRAHAQQGKMWQAGNSFHNAFNLWGEVGITDFNLGETGLFQEKVEQEFLHSSKVWASLLDDQGKVEQETQLLETVFQFFPLDTELTRQLYDLHARSGNHKRAKKILSHYGKAHQQLSNNPQEIVEAMAAFWKSPCSE